jgi:hypothetical protein
MSYPTKEDNYKQQYLNNLKIEIANNARVYYAVKLKDVKPILPIRPPEFKSIEEKENDMQGMLNQLRENLTGLTDGVSSTLITNDLKQNIELLRFVLQTFPSIKEYILKTYSLGINYTAFITYVEQQFNKNNALIVAVQPLIQIQNAQQALLDEQARLAQEALNLRLRQQQYIYAQEQLRLQLIQDEKQRLHDEEQQREQDALAEELRLQAEEQRLIEIEKEKEEIRLKKIQDAIEAKRKDDWIKDKEKKARDKVEYMKRQKEIEINQEMEQRRLLAEEKLLIAENEARNLAYQRTLQIPLFEKMDIVPSKPERSVKNISFIPKKSVKTLRKEEEIKQKLEYEIHRNAMIEEIITELDLELYNSITKIEEDKSISSELERVNKIEEAKRKREINRINYAKNLKEHVERLDAIEKEQRILNEQLLKEQQDQELARVEEENRLAKINAERIEEDRINAENQQKIDNEKNEKKKNAMIKVKEITLRRQKEKREKEDRIWDDEQKEKRDKAKKLLEENERKEEERLLKEQQEAEKKELKLRTMNQDRVFSLGRQKYDERKKIRDNSKGIFSWWSPSIELADISNMKNKTNEQKLIDYIVFKLEEQDKLLETERQNQRDEDLKRYNAEIEINRILKEEQKNDESIIEDLLKVSKDEETKRQEKFKDELNIIENNITNTNGEIQSLENRKKTLANELNDITVSIGKDVGNLQKIVEKYEKLRDNRISEITGLRTSIQLLNSNIVKKEDSIKKAEKALNENKNRISNDASIHYHDKFEQKLNLDKEFQTFIAVVEPTIIRLKNDFKTLEPKLKPLETENTRLLAEEKIKSTAEIATNSSTTQQNANRKNSEETRINKSLKSLKTEQQNLETKKKTIEDEKKTKVYNQKQQAIKFKNDLDTYRKKLKTEMDSKLKLQRETKNKELEILLDKFKQENNNKLEEIKGVISGISANVNLLSPNWYK